MLAVKFRLLSRLTVIALTLFMAAGYGTVQAVSDENIQSIQNGTAYYEPAASNSPSGSSCGSGDVTLSGSDSIQQAFNFFISEGLGEIQSAGIVGNLLLESAGTMNPEIVEGGSTQSDPSDLTTSLQGYGIAQWTPGDKLITLAQEYNITTPVNQLSTQLLVLWDEINSGGSTSIVSALKNLTTTTDTTTYFQNNFEKPLSETASIGERISYANQVITLYGSSSATGGTINITNGCGSASVDCTGGSGSKVTGNAAIACDVLQYDPISYCEASSCPGLEAGHLPGATWHADCPVIGTKCATDCSGLVSLAIYDVFGNNGDWDTYSMVTDTTNFKEISYNQLLPGDFVEPNPGHVVVVESVSGTTINGFAAQTASNPQPQQVGPEPVTESPSNVYLRYIGVGSTYNQ